MLIPATSWSEESRDFYIEQVINLTLAKKHGKQVKWRGDNFSQTMQAICWRESHAGARYFQTAGFVVGDKKGKYKSLGPWQIQIPTARFIGHLKPNLFNEKFGDGEPPDKKIVFYLLTDLDWSARMACAHFEYLLNYFGDYKTAILAYNKGIGGAKKFLSSHKVGDSEYVRSVIKYRKSVIREFNRDNIKIKF